MSAGHCNFCVIGELKAPWNEGDLYRCLNEHCGAFNIAPLETNPSGRAHVRLLAAIDIPLEEVEAHANDK